MIGWRPWNIFSAGLRTRVVCKENELGRPSSNTIRLLLGPHSGQLRSIFERFYEGSIRRPAQGMAIWRSISAGSLMNALLVIVTGLLCCHALVRRHGIAHPATLFVVMWILLAALHAINPLHFTPASFQASVTIALGVVAVTLGTLMSRPRGADPIKSRPNAITFAAVASILSLAVAYGVVSFRQTIADTLGGVSDFDSLDQSRILYAVAYGGARGGGIDRLMFALAPLVACLGVLGGARLHKAWYMLIPLTLFATTQTPGRTLTFTLVCVAVSFYLYTRSNRDKERSSAKAVCAAAAAVVVVILYFNAVGASLGKNQMLVQALGRTAVPDFLTAPLTYLLGGISALSQAQAAGVDPGEPGRSIFTVVKVGEMLGLPVQSPEVISRYVLMPVPINVFTGFGDVWFDFGYLGLFIYFVLVGSACAIAHRSAVRGSLRSAWVASMFVSVLATSAMSVRLFYVDTVALLAVGWIVFGLLDQSSFSRTRQPPLTKSVSRN